MSRSPTSETPYRAMPDGAEAEASATPEDGGGGGGGGDRHVSVSFAAVPSPDAFEDEPIAPGTPVNSGGGPGRSARRPKKSNDALFRSKLYNPGGKSYRNPNNLLLSSNDEEVDTDMLARTVAEAGRWAFGIMAADVWVLSDDATHLYQPSGGFWIDPVFRICYPSEALERLVNDQREDYHHPRRLAMGEGLGGCLWFDTLPGRHGLPAYLSTRKSVGSKLSGGGGGAADDAHVHDFQGTAGFGRTVVWRDVKGLADDPDQPPNLKVKLLNEAGFGLAAGVPFNVRGHRGIVVYLARATADPEELKKELNEDYLRCASDAIGAVSALRRPRRACIKARRQEARSALARAKKKILFLNRSNKIQDFANDVQQSMPVEGLNSSFVHHPETGVTAETMAELNTPEKEQDPGLCVRAGKDLKARGKMWARKLRGGGVTPPPWMPPAEAAFAFCGAFVTLLVILYVNDFTERLTEPDIFIIMGPIAALQTVVYGLFPAPASQPRNMILGNCVSIPPAIILKYIYSPVAHWKTALAVAISVFNVCSLGIVHPPATALAGIFALSERPPNDEWEFFGMVLAANLIVLLMATVINNLNQKRQYPIYWGHITTYLHGLIKAQKKKKEKVEDDNGGETTGGETELDRRASMNSNWSETSDHLEGSPLRQRKGGQ